MKAKHLRSQPLFSTSKLKVDRPLVRLDVDGRVDRNHITVNGEIQLVGGLANATGGAELVYSPPSLRANATYSFLGDLVTMTSRFAANSNMDVTMFGQATVRMPE